MRICTVQSRRRTGWQRLNLRFGQLGGERQWWYVRPEAAVLATAVVLMGAAELDGSEMLDLRGCRADSSRDKHALLPALRRTAERG